MRYVGGFIFATFLACTAVPLYVLSAVAVMQVAVCPLTYMGREKPPTNPEALEKWNPPGFTDCIASSFGSVAGRIQRIWK